MLHKSLKLRPLAFTALDELVIILNLLLELFNLFFKLVAPALAPLVLLHNLVVLQVVLCHLAENSLIGLGLDVQLVQLSTDFVDRFCQLFSSRRHPLARHHLNRLGS